MSASKLDVSFGILLLTLHVLAGCGRLGFEHRDEPDEPPIPADARAPDAASHVLYVAVQGASASHVQLLHYDGAAASVQSRIAKNLASVRIDAIEGSRLRSLMRLDSDTLTVGMGGQNSHLLALQGESLTAGATHDFTGVLRNTHGHCYLPNGNVIAGEYSTGLGNNVAEFSRTGDTFQYSGQVYSTVHNGSTLTHCIAPTNDELFLADQNATNDRDGDVVRLLRAGPNWSETHRLDLSDLGVETSVYSFVIHSGFLYAFPLRRDLAQVQSLLRCPTSDIQAGNCVELSDLPADQGGGANGEDAIQAAVLVPGGQEILFATNRRLYRYDLGDDAWQELYDMGAGFDDLLTAGGDVDPLEVVRGLVID